MILRRQFMSLLGGAAAAALRSQAVYAQHGSKLPTIGVIGPSAAVWRPWIDAFAERLHELGWTERRTVAIEYRWTDGRPERVLDIAAEFLRLKIDVILASGDAVAIAKETMPSVPMVFPISNTPLGSGLVGSLARPGGNVTGLSVQGADLAGKRLELLREIVPGLRRFAIMVNVGFSQAVLEMREVQAMARTLGIEVVLLEIQRAEDIAPAFEMLKDRANALYVVGNSLLAANRARIITFAVGARLPTLFNNRAHVQAGALMSYGPNFPDLFRRAAVLVDKFYAVPSPLTYR